MTPLAAWRARLAEGRISHDPAQERAAELLEGLYRALLHYKPATGAGGWRERLGLARRPEQPAPQGLYLFGAVGRGKSMLMDLFYEVAPVERKRRVHFHAFMAEIHARIHAWRQEAARQNRKADDPIVPLADAIAAESWLLCFDEFQVTDIADAMILGRLFERLFQRGVVVVATSNSAPDELYKDGLQRALFLPFIALFKQKLDVHQLESARDYRLNRLSGRRVIWWPADAPETRAALAGAWSELTDDAAGAPLDVAVLGRVVTLPQAARGVARAGFADLCAAALGASDYLAIAQAIEVLILTDVPVLAPERRNETRRLITLIDTLYEARTRLVMSAEAAPEALVPAGQHAGEFKRTASRLAEMSAAGWWERS